MKKKFIYIPTHLPSDLMMAVLLHEIGHFIDGSMRKINFIEYQTNSEYWRLCEDIADNYALQLARYYKVLSIVRYELGSLYELPLTEEAA